MRRLMGIGVDGITTDRPEVLLKVRNEVAEGRVADLTLRERYDDFGYVLPSGMKAERNVAVGLLFWLTFLLVWKRKGRSIFRKREWRKLISPIFVYLVFLIIATGVISSPASLLVGGVACAAASYFIFAFFCKFRPKYAMMNAIGSPVVAAAWLIIMTFALGSALGGILRAIRWSLLG